MANRKTKRYDWNEDDFEVSAKIDLPENLKPIVKSAPKDDVDLGKYLNDLLVNETITISEAGFLLDSGAFE